MYLFGVGIDNKYGHPSEEVITRIEANKEKIFRTDRNGEIQIILDKNGNIINIQSYLKK